MYNSIFILKFIFYGSIYSKSNKQTPVKIIQVSSVQELSEIKFQFFVAIQRGKSCVSIYFYDNFFTKICLFPFIFPSEFWCFITLLLSAVLKFQSNQPDKMFLKIYLRITKTKKITYYKQHHYSISSRLQLAHSF